MKLYSVLLLIVFLCATLFIGVVSNISASTRDQELYWIAEASARRSGGINNDRLHVNMWGIAECTARAHFTTLEVSLKIDNKPNLDKTPQKYIQHGSGYLVENLRSAYEQNGGEAKVKSGGYYYPLSATFAIEVTEYVGTMPPPQDIYLPPSIPDDCPCDEEGLYSVNGMYTATPGESHESCVTTDAPYSEIYWYVAAPGETGLGTSYEIDTGDGTTTKARFSYTFPSGAMHTGTYKITAYIYRWNQSIYEESYNVDVSVN